MINTCTVRGVHVLILTGFISFISFHSYLMQVPSNLQFAICPLLALQMQKCNNVNCRQSHNVNTYMIRRDAWCSVLEGTVINQFCVRKSSTHLIVANGMV